MILRFLFYQKQLTHLDDPCIIVLSNEQNDKETNK